MTERTQMANRGELLQQDGVDACALSARLRQGTQAEHRAIEEVAAMRRLFAPDYRMGEYRALLGRLYGFYQALEPGLFAGLPAALRPALAHRRKTPLLERDLAALGVGETGREALALCFALPPLEDDCAAGRLGVFYVLEGSTLGGQIIGRRLAGHFEGCPAAIEDALHFFRAYGPDNGRQWRRLRELLDDYGATAGATARERALQAARQTFVSLRHWLEGSREGC